MLLKYARKKVFYCQVRQQTTTQKYNEQSTKVGFFFWSSLVKMHNHNSYCTKCDWSEFQRRLSSIEWSVIWSTEARCDWSFFQPVTFMLTLSVVVVNGTIRQQLFYRNVTELVIFFSWKQTKRQLKTESHTTIKTKSDRNGYLSVKLILTKHHRQSHASQR